MQRENRWRSDRGLLLLRKQMLDVNLPAHDGSTFRFDNELERGPLILVVYRDTW
jgi:hypothetical protein